MSWIDEPLIVHVGLHKTASSWLQEHYLPHAQYGFWFPPLAPDSRRPVKAAGHILLWNENQRLIDEDEFDVSAARSRLAEYEKPHGLIPVISNERLAGHPLSNGYDRQTLARRILLVFPQARILLVIREQNALIMSNYMQYLKYGGWHTPEGYLKPQSDGRKPDLSLRFWDYSRL